jgi:hypothetical protein
MGFKERRRLNNPNVKMQAKPTTPALSHRVRRMGTSAEEWLLTAGVAADCTVSVEVAVTDPAGMMDGLKEQLMPGGIPSDAHASVTGELSVPVAGVTVTVAVPFPPGENVSDPGFSERVKLPV